MISKQVIIVRKDLGMRKGKMIAQGAHASMKVLLDMWTVDKDITDDMFNYVLSAPDRSAIQDWLSGTFTKITLSVNSEEELIEIYNKAKELLLPCSLVEDVGKTEFNGIKTKTAIAIGPAWADEIDPLTSHLKLL